MPDASKPNQPKPPSRRGLPRILSAPPDDDGPAAWIARLAGGVYATGEELHRKALGISRDGDLTPSGQKKALAKTVAEAVGKFLRANRRGGQAARSGTPDAQHDDRLQGRRRQG